jgi:hypothetical protein
MVQLTPQSSGQPSEPTSWQWGHSHKRVRWARSAESTAMATFQGGLSDPQGPSYSSGQQGGAHSLQRSERHRFVIRHQIYLNAYLWCHTQVIFFPTAHPVKLSSYPIVTPPILSPCLLHRRLPKFGNKKWHDIKLHFYCPFQTVVMEKQNISSTVKGGYTFWVIITLSAEILRCDQISPQGLKETILFLLIVVYLNIILI